MHRMPVEDRTGPRDARRAANSRRGDSGPTQSCKIRDVALQAIFGRGVGFFHFFEGDVVW